MSTKLDEHILNSTNEKAHDISFKVSKGVNQGKKYSMSQNILTIGRTNDNDITLIHLRVSKQHASIEIKDHQLVIKDLGSSNGTYVNGKRINSPTILHDGDVINIGKACVMKLRGTSSIISKNNDFEPDKLDSLLTDAGQVQSDLSKIRSELDLTKEPKLKSSQRSSKKFLLIIIILAGFAYLIYDFIVPKITHKTSSATKKGSLLSSAQSVKPANQKEPVHTLDTSSEIFNIEHNFNPSKLEANKLFKKAHQTYLSNRFNDAIRLFKEVLLFDKHHVLAQIYLERAQSELSGLVEQYDREGKVLFDNLRYNESIVKFRIVVNLLQNNPKDPRYQDAKRYIRMAEQKLMKRF